MKLYGTGIVYLSLFSVSFGCGRFLVYILPSRLTSRWNRSSNACSCEHGMRFPRYFTISSGYGGLRRNLAPGFQQYMLKLVCAGIMTALRSLYHILRIQQPPAEFSARISAVHAETGMRRYNNRSAVIIPSRLTSRWAARQMHAHASMACVFLAIIPYPSLFMKKKGRAAC